MKARTHVRSRGRKRQYRPAPVRLPGLKFDTFEAQAERREGAYSTDRAPTYQSRYAAQFPKRYIKKFVAWFRGQPAQRKAGALKRPRAAIRRRRVTGKRGKAKRALH